MHHPTPRSFTHPEFSRRSALQAGSIGLMGLGMSDLSMLRATNTPNRQPAAKSVIFIFLTGGISHQDTFDMKPDAPDSVRGEFQPIATQTPGLQICEHLPLLAQRTQQYALVRSVGTDSNAHEFACHMLLTGRQDLPPGFNLNNIPNPNEWPSIPSLVTYTTRGRNNLPPAIVLPEPSVNEANRVRPGQYAGRLGPRWESWHVDIAAKCPKGNGACPDCFRFDNSPFEHAANSVFSTPMLTLPDGGSLRLSNRINLLESIELQQRNLEEASEGQRLNRHREQALSVLADPRTHHAFDVENAPAKLVDRYGKNKFGLSLLMSYRLIEAGVNLVQVNLGKNSSWDTHRGNFVNLKQNLLPYTDRAVSALLDDLSSSGLLDDTLVVMTGEFGRTPKINKDAGRDHWGPVMTVLLAGAGVQGGNVLGASDKIAAYPTRDRQTPENLSATIYNALGISQTMKWTDFDGRDYALYRGNPIPGLMS